MLGPSQTLCRQSTQIQAATRMRRNGRTTTATGRPSNCHTSAHAASRTQRSLRIIADVRSGCKCAVVWWHRRRPPRRVPMAARAAHSCLGRSCGAAKPSRCQPNGPIRWFTLTSKALFGRRVWDQRGPGCPPRVWLHALPRTSRQSHVNHVWRELN